MDLSQLVIGHSLVRAQEIALTGGGSIASRTQRLKWTTAEAYEDVGADDADDAVPATPSGYVDSVVGSGFASAGARRDGGEDSISSASYPVGGRHGGEQGRVILRPMEIKTYRLELVPAW